MSRLILRWKLFILKSWYGDCYRCGDFQEKKAHDVYNWGQTDLTRL